MKKLVVFLITGLIFFIPMPYVFSESVARKETVNILTWWGYLNHPDIIKAAEDHCNVTLSFDEYFSNDEFLRRWESQKDNYDVIIFSDTIYNVIKDKIPQIPSSTLWKQSKFYHPVIKNRYFKLKYPPNVVYFMHSVTGFLWNPHNIALSSQDSIKTIFKKSARKYAVIIDDPVEAQKLLEAGIFKRINFISDPDILSIPTFKTVTQDAKVYITNDYSELYKKSKFAFSFGWSGAAISALMEIGTNYKFLVHPNLSYVSSDLITQTSLKHSSACVSKFLSNKNISLILQEKNFYFSPYGDYANVKNTLFKKIYMNFISLLPSLIWSNSIHEKEFKKINKSWQVIKISLNNHFIGE